MANLTYVHVHSLSVKACTLHTSAAEDNQQKDVKEGVGMHP